VVVTKEERNRIVVSLIPLVKRIAKKIAVHLPEYAGVEEQDLVNEGILAILKAFDNLKKGSLDKGGNLRPEARNYLLIRAKGAMFDLLRSLDFGAKNVREWEKKLEEAKRELAERLGREPTEKELALALNVDEHWLTKLEEKIGFSYILSLEEIFNRERFREGFEGIISGGINVEETVERKELLSKLKKALEKLDERELLVLQLSFFEELKTQHIAEILNISVGRVAQIKKKALQKLAKEMERFL
jgi:RNA polymerase sigma factor for flagellar operon FliA